MSIVIQLYSLPTLFPILGLLVSPVLPISFWPSVHVGVIGANGRRRMNHHRHVAERARTLEIRASNRVDDAAL